MVNITFTLHFPLLLRESFNGRKAVSKTVNEGSIPSSRANKAKDINEEDCKLLQGLL